MPCSHTGSLKLSSAPSQTAYLTPSLRASALSPGPFLGRSASGASLMNASATSLHSPTRSLRSSHSQSWGSLTPSQARKANFELAHAPPVVQLSVREQCFDNSSAKIDRQLEWNSHALGDAVPWQTYRTTNDGREGPLHLQRGVKPRWVAKAPGTFNDTFERAPLGSQAKARGRSMSRRTPKWDASHHVIHSLDHSPVMQGSRKGLDNRTGVAGMRSVKKVEIINGIMPSASP